MGVTSRNSEPSTASRAFGHLMTMNRPLGSSAKASAASELLDIGVLHGVHHHNWGSKRLCQNIQVPLQIIHTRKERLNSSNKLSTGDSFPWAWVEKAAGNREQSVSISLWDVKLELTTLWFMENQGLFGERAVCRSCASRGENTGLSSAHQPTARANILWVQEIGKWPFPSESKIVSGLSLLKTKRYIFVWVQYV